MARSIALRKLAVRAHTRVELERALAGRHVPAEAAAIVLDRLADVGLIDDSAFAEEWVTTRQRRRRLSASALRRELTARGISREETEAALAGVDDEAEFAAATELAQRKARSMQGLDREVRYRRLAGALARRGFGSGLSARVLERVVDVEKPPRD